jgi:hypothetical protein
MGSHPNERELITPQGDILTFPSKNNLNTRVAN